MIKFIKKELILMNAIRPISDLRNNFTEISKIIHETKEPIFLTKNGYGNMVVMSIDTYDEMYFNSEVYSKLVEAEKQMELTNQRFSSKDVLKKLSEVIEVNEDV